MNVGLYARVSTADKGQSPEMQLRELLRGFRLSRRTVPLYSKSEIQAAARPIWLRDTAACRVRVHSKGLTRTRCMSFRASRWARM